MSSISHTLQCDGVTPNGRCVSVLSAIGGYSQAANKASKEGWLIVARNLHYCSVCAENPERQPQNKRRKE